MGALCLVCQVGSVVGEGEFKLHPCPAPEPLNREFLGCASVAVVLLGDVVHGTFPGWTWLELALGDSGGSGSMHIFFMMQFQTISKFELHKSTLSSNTTSTTEFCFSQFAASCTYF